VATRGNGPAGGPTRGSALTSTDGRRAHVNQLLALARRLEEGAGYVQAIEIYRVVADSAGPPDSCQARLSLGALYERLGRPGSATRAYEVAIGCGNPRCGAVANLGLGRLYAGTGDGRRALKAFERASRAGDPAVAAAARAGIEAVRERVGRRWRPTRWGLSRASLRRRVRASGW
jgi:tetratricopeptide (TPR) repeat protein